MRFLRSIVLLLVLPGGAMVGFAQSDGEPQRTADLGYASRYVFRGVERAGGSVQASAEYAVGGFRGTVWTNQPLNGGRGGEVDLTAAYAHQASERLNVEFAFTAYRFTNIPAGETEHSLEAGLTATWSPINGFVPRVSLRRDFRMEADTAEAALGYSLPLTTLGTFLEFSAFVGWVDAANARPDAAGPRARDSYGYAGAEAHVPYRVSAHCTVVAGVHGTTTVNQGGTFGAADRSARSNLWLTLGVSVDF